MDGDVEGWGDGGVGEDLTTQTGTVCETISIVAW